MVQLQEMTMSKRYHIFLKYCPDWQSVVCQEEEQVTSQVLGEAKPRAEKTKQRECMGIKFILK
jgi:hypothetical protein